MTVREYRFRSRSAWGTAIARTVAAGARAQVVLGRRPVIAFSGGNTAEGYLPEVRRRAHLAQLRPIVTLADDRCVPALDRRSNEGLVRRNVAGWAGASPGPDIIPLQRGPEYVNERRRRDVAISKIRPIDVAVLGLGTDGHIASLFPDMPQLWHASSATVRFRRPSESFDRVSLTLDVLDETPFLVLALRGSDKWDVWAHVRETGLKSDSPLAKILEARVSKNNRHLHVFGLLPRGITAGQ